MLRFLIVTVRSHANVVRYRSVDAAGQQTLTIHKMAANQHVDDEPKQRGVRRVEIQSTLLKWTTSSNEMESFATRNPPVSLTLTAENSA
ncbi:hypothetical protein RRSWK_06384 [Rhodopirellula sp. SWK7]|nr:hypothetical protein RRSWK_06384 [Rhodopirellula sp. SWK7]